MGRGAEVDGLRGGERCIRETWMERGGESDGEGGRD
ncbi:hypothetical protein A2U01_0040461 [Trifolium medium]|uniref:Uncharacterized protein n=1 Tax=Trifolium medium TaxID=97028 RepID=A0A392Q7S0_9FABA|nr:hypothetical protein [Trifolium medium]